MLRVLIVLVLIANALAWVWRENGFETWGLPARPAMPAAAMPETPLNPERIMPSDGQQAAPDHLATGTEQALIVPQDTSAWVCWRLGPYAPDQELYLQAALPLNNDRLSGEVKQITLPQRWAVVTPKSTASDVAAWKEQAKAQNIDHRTSDADVLKGRLILATFVSRDLANKATEQLTQKGWEALSVVRERPPINALSLEIRSPDEAALDTIKGRVAAIPALGGQAVLVSTCPQTVAAANRAPTISTVSPDASASDDKVDASRPKVTPVRE